MEHTEQNTPKRIIRFLIDDSVSGWTVYPVDKALRVYRGEICLPHYASQSLRVAFAHLEHEIDRQTKLARLEAAEWAFNESGYIDEKKVMQGIIAKLDDPIIFKVDTDFAVSHPLMAEDISAIRKALKIT